MQGAMAIAKSREIDDFGIGADGRKLVATGGIDGSFIHWAGTSAAIAKNYFCL